MEKIKDERLQLKNLKNIRITFIVQTLGIMGVLLYDLINHGMDGMTDNPVWFVFIMTGVVNAYLSMTISVEHEKTKGSPVKRLYIALGIITLISLLFVTFIALTNGYNVMDGLLVGGIVFVCSVIPAFYMYGLRQKEREE
ncbi:MULTISPECIES: hypothetical protein [Halobacillus]|uniref:hypothetical protein n=1 Tax=Halobacillus TaxID=45667 RepID=UPI000401C3D6|nr:MULTISPECIES: hypothetical protein [Halobacillus]